MDDPGIGMALSSMATNGNVLNQNVARLIQTISSILPFTASAGVFTLAAAATTTVNSSFVKSNSIILWAPTNAAAGTNEGSAKALYLSARTAGVSFAVSTASAAAAAGSETFTFIVVNPT